jgi:hypothetical protein
MLGFIYFSCNIGTYLAAQREVLSLQSICPIAYRRVFNNFF